ncbi:MAG: SprT family zinc-dependent metalloprotease [Verrucomicrobiota bacterium]
MSKSETLATVVGSVQLRRTQRTTLSISVHPNGSVEVVAPARAPVADIQAKITKRAAWIRRQKRAFAGMNAIRPPRRHCGGSTHRYLGRQYRLKVNTGSPCQVKLIGGYFQVTARTRSEGEVKQLMDDWMRTRAVEQFSRRVELWREWCKREKLPMPRVLLRSMPKRWGSAHKDGLIFLNPELVRAPSICIDYVIAHELCHLKHPNHGPQFYDLLDELFPRWREIKARLESAEL